MTNVEWQVLSRLWANIDDSKLGTRHSTLTWAGFLLLVLLLPNPAHAQAWTMPAGTAYTKVSYGHVTAAEQYTFDGRATDYISGLAGETFKDRSLYLYTEFGVSDHVSVVLSVPYKRTFVRDHAFRFRIFGLGSVAIGSRVSLMPLLGMNPTRQALAVNVMAYVPTGYTRNFTPSTGAGQIDFQATLFYGRSFHPLPVYAQIGGGYRHRSSIYTLSQTVPCISGSDIHCITDPRTAFGDEALMQAELGISPLGGFLLLQVIGLAQWSIEAPVVGFSAINPLPTHQRNIKAGAGITMYPFRPFRFSGLDSLGFSIQYFSTPYGRNTINSTDIFVGVEFRPRFFNTASNTTQ